MKKFLMFVAAMCMMASMILLCGCNKNTTAATAESKTSATETESTTASNSTALETISYTINVYDIDDELLSTKIINGSKNDVFDKLKENFTVNYTESDYGAYLVSIDGQITDNNYYVAIYENGVMASTGVEELVADNNDVFEFKMECWNTLSSGYGTLDDTDVLVDKIIYHYAKTYMQDYIKADETFSSSDYWTYMSVYMMSSNGYDSTLFNCNNAGDKLKSSLKDAVLSELSGASIGKYYYTARALNLDLTSFKEFYSKYITDTLSDSFESEYSTPFIISPAKSLDVTSDNLKSVIATTYKASTDWGIDGLAWQLTSLKLFDKYTKDDLSCLELSDYGNACSDALVLMAYAAFNESPRTQDKDLVKTLIDTYYDSSLKLIKYEIADTGLNYSTNQIYAGLMAYKASRDLGKAVNIFA